MLLLVLLLLVLWCLLWLMMSAMKWLWMLCIFFGRQVYKARVRRTGALVALKVQRPDAFRSAAVDMYLLR